MGCILIPKLSAICISTPWIKGSHGEIGEYRKQGKAETRESTSLELSSFTGFRGYFGFSRITGLVHSGLEKRIRITSDFVIASITYGQQAKFKRQVNMAYYGSRWFQHIGET
jgi:hypothetical protein